MQSSRERVQSGAVHSPVPAPRPLLMCLHLDFCQNPLPLKRKVSNRKAKAEKTPVSKSASLLLLQLSLWMPGVPDTSEKLPCCGFPFSFGAEVPE